MKTTTTPTTKPTPAATPTPTTPKPATTPAATPTPPAATSKKVVELTRITTPRKGSSIVYTSPTLRGTVKFARSLFGAEPPARIVIEGDGFAGPFIPKAKMSKEQRAAARAALTPQDKARVARERADRAMARAAKLEAAAAS